MKWQAETLELNNENVKGQFSSLMLLLSGCLVSIQSKSKGKTKIKLFLSSVRVIVFKSYFQYCIRLAPFHSAFSTNHIHFYMRLDVPGGFWAGFVSFRYLIVLYQIMKLRVQT